MWQSWRDNESFNNRKFLFVQFYFIQSNLTGGKLRLTVLVVVRYKYEWCCWADFVYYINEYCYIRLFKVKSDT